MPDSPRPKMVFRIGASRASSGEYKPFATVGVSSDGGVFVAPVAVRDFGWQYGVSRHPDSDNEGAIELANTKQRPKLHYHRSGIASATLTGQFLERAQMRFPPVNKVRQSQILSIVSVRPWELQTAAGSRKGDMSILERTWPQTVGVSLSLMKISKATSLVMPEAKSAVGLIRGNDSMFAVDFSHFLSNTVLLARVRVSNEPTHLEPGISVAAVGWNASARPENAETFVLATSSMRNPLVMREDEIPSPVWLEELSKHGSMFTSTATEHADRIWPPERP